LKTFKAPQALCWTQLQAQRRITEGEGIGARSLPRNISGVEGCVGVLGWD